MRLLGLLVIAVVAAVAGGAGSALAAPATTTPSTTPTPAAPSGSPVPETGIPMLDEVLNTLAGNLGLGGTGSSEVDSSQMIVVTAPEANDTTATLTAFERGTDDAWKPVIGPTEAFLGSLGMGEPEDNVYRTPEGTFDLDQAFGRLPNPGTKMPYKQVDRQDWWDSNMKSPTYNTMVRQVQSPGGDSENLYDSGPVYDYAVNIAHNPERIPGKASAMFLHVTNNQPTMGCIAIEKDLMRQVLTWLDPAKHPKIAIGVNQAGPSGSESSTPQTSTPQSSTPQSAVPESATPQSTLPSTSPSTIPGADSLTQLLNQLVSLLPSLFETTAGP
ncbi:L,D-transpeptidase family protein [Gordonia sp. HNM0687]|uniref:L,D-transpeptidase family protein n=1 Tax=Gordonia mangrovi TaxID=2665643 RepID=A0A6L7GU67_9ACTN|nr:L,D-transpeptidase family protein [Gordonia mangrovi]MXP23007.1 L,D-transpeptidase family protein [Gordonia mangrovi]UVF77297.1 L,D-transpeptidase family protein [Gordonia mangrovi]